MNRLHLSGRYRPTIGRSVSRGSFRIVLLAVVGLSMVDAGAGAAQSTFYRWTDESGNLVLSDRPPERADIEYETVSADVPTLRRRSATSAPPSPPAAGPGTGSSPRPAASERTDETAAAPRVARDPAMCERAKTHLSVLDTKPRIRVYGDDGELRYLTPEQIEKQKEATRRAIELHCEAG